MTKKNTKGSQHKHKDSNRCQHHSNFSKVMPKSANLGKKGPPSWIFKCSLIWILRNPNMSFYVNYHASAAIIKYLNK